MPRGSAVTGRSGAGCRGSAPRSWLSYLEVKTPVLCSEPALCTQTDLISVIHTDIYLQICLYRDTEPCIYR